MITINGFSAHRSTTYASIIIALLLSVSQISAQQKRSENDTQTTPQTSKGAAVNSPPLLTRTITRREVHRLGYGGTVTIIGAPEGSITIEGWPRNEVELAADIELRGETEEDLGRLASVNGIAFDADSNHVRILSTGTHDKVFMRRVARGFPKKLLGLPWKINYRLRVPMVADVEINAGRGPIILSGVQGSIILTAAESETQLTVTGGTLNVTLASGTVVLRILERSWRGNGAVIRIAAGDLTLELPSGFNGDIDADILRFGKIEDSYGGLESRQKPGLTPTVVRARAGAGGPSFKFTIGDGTIYIRKAVTSDK